MTHPRDATASLRGAVEAQAAQREAAAELSAQIAADRAASTEDEDTDKEDQ
jgi:hypothetical protein